MLVKVEVGDDGLIFLIVIGVYWVWNEVVLEWCDVGGVWSRVVDLKLILFGFLCIVSYGVNNGFCFFWFQIVVILFVIL